MPTSKRVLKPLLTLLVKKVNRPCLDERVTVMGCMESSCLTLAVRMDINLFLITKQRLILMLNGSLRLPYQTEQLRSLS